MENEGGTVIEKQNETDRLKRQKAKLERDRKEAKAQEKENAQTIKERDKAAREVERLRRIYDDEKQKMNTGEARLNRTKPLEDLKEKEEILKRKIEENRRIMNDKNVSRELRQAAAVRYSENTDELAGLEHQIQEREEFLPLRERIRNIFDKLREKLRENTTTLKKLGYTLQAIILVAGIVIGAVALKVTNVLATGTKAIGNGLKKIGKKVASILPGLIGTIVSFIFKTGGQVLSFLGEHAWLLILAVVAFLMETLLKKRRRQ